jgi:hypothetical protein
MTSIVARLGQLPLNMLSTGNYHKFVLEKICFILLAASVCSLSCCTNAAIIGTSNLGV